MMGAEARKVILLVLFVPSADRDGKTLGAEVQDRWMEKAKNELGRLFGGATAMPPAHGVWRDDERGGKLISDRPILIHSYISETDAIHPKLLAEFGKLCRTMLKELRQGEVAAIWNNQYMYFR
jgi:hypothetical protein